MAKLKAPLMSLGASGAIGKAIVYFGWKGLDVVREYVVPSNPQTKPQMDQRGYLATCVAMIHSRQAHTAHPLGEIDTMAYALLGSTLPTPRTWFNQAVKIGLDQLKVGDEVEFYSDAALLPGAGSLGIAIYGTSSKVTNGNFFYGTSKTALIHSTPATIVGTKIDKNIVNLTPGVKYYIQFRPTLPVKYPGANSGIYYGVAG